MEEAGFGLELLGLGIKTVKWIKNVASKKVLITPSDIEINTKHWDSTNSIIIQNLNERPIFSIQIVCWFNEGQLIEFEPHHTEKVHNVGDIAIDAAMSIVQGYVDDGRKLYILGIGRLLPKESIEVDLQIKGRGKVRFMVVHYDESRGATILKRPNEIAVPFKPPFNMSLEAIAFRMRKMPSK